MVAQGALHTPLSRLLSIQPASHSRALGSEETRGERAKQGLLASRIGWCILPILGSDRSSL